MEGNMGARFYIELGKELKNIRTNRHISQQYVADRMGLSRSAISCYEVGKRQMNIDDLFKICEIYNYDINELVNKVRKYLYK